MSGSMPSGIRRKSGVRMPKIKRLRVRNRGAKRELFVQRKSFAFFIFILLSALAMLASYIVFDNSRVTVDRVTVAIPSLPKDMESYTVLLIADLHGRQFGEGQSGVLAALGSSRFDVVLLGGDLIGHDGSAEGVYGLVEALAPLGKPIYAVQGNHDPALYRQADGDCTLDPFWQGLVDRGAQLLEAPVPLKQIAQDSDEVDTLWLWPLDQLSTDVGSAIATVEDNLLTLSVSDAPEVHAEARYNEILLANFQQLEEVRQAVMPEDTHLSLSHYPVTPAQMETIRDIEHSVGGPSVPDVDLLMAGHYHAGQWRVPGIGALCVSASDLPRGGVFPQQDAIAGLTWIEEGLPQYISRGLGASGPVVLRYRVFNPPQIALIQLSSRGG